MKVMNIITITMNTVTVDVITTIMNMSTSNIITIMMTTATAGVNTIMKNMNTTNIITIMMTTAIVAAVMMTMMNQLQLLQIVKVNGQATVFIVEKLGCAHCAGKMEEQISHLPGVEAVNLTFATKQLRVWSDDAKTLLPQIQDICTSIEPDVKVVVRENTVRAQKEAKKAKENSEDNREFWELGVGIVLFIAGKALESSKPVYSMVCFILAYLILGIKIVWTALKNISKGQFFDENFLMSIATIGAFGVGEFAEAVGVMMFYRIGELFEEKAVERSRSQIMDVIDMRPEVVNLVDDHGDVTVIDAEEAEIGDILLVRPGDRIPLDGIITDGET